jgi:ectoine hydroxylase-related dioxygenase (phytanoyl-CoA dioxygenase family)
MATTTSTTTATATAPTKELRGNNADVNRNVNHALLAQPVNLADYEKAVEIIKARLPMMTETKAKFIVNLGAGHPEVLVDGRTSSPTLEVLSGAAPDDVDAHVLTRAPMVRRLYDGIVDSRYAARWGYINMLSGSTRVGVKFGDALTGFNQIHPRLADLDLSELPKPTEDIAQVKRDLDRWGYGFVKNALTGDELARVKKRLAEQAKGEAEAGKGVFDGGPNKPNQRLLCLPNKGQEFLDLLNNKVVDDFVPDFLGDDAILFSYTANIARYGNVPMHMHTDQITIQPPIRSIAVGMNLMYFLEDVTPENGGTLVMPGSHKGNLAPDDPWDPVDTVAASGPAGTCMVFESRLWHATGANRTPGSERPVILLFFVRPWVRQQENFSLSLKDEVFGKCSDRVKAFLGFKMSGSIGSVQGFGGTEGSIVRRPRGDEYIGELGRGSL